MKSAEPARIAGFLDSLAEIGVDESGGWTRLAFSAEERQAHELFRTVVEGYGAEVRTDCFGNTMARLPGVENPMSVLMTGSHLDTVYQGGNFDGAVGVAAAIEAIRVVAESGGLRHPMVAIAFAAEEGARFGAPCIGSRLMTGAFTSTTLRSLFDRSGRTAYDCAVGVGLDPEAGERSWDPADVACFVEVHIEQGRILEERGRQLGIVHSIGGSTRVEMHFAGRADHSGATPMWLRRDALAAAAEFVLAVERAARMHATTVATVGRLDVRPNSLTTVPGSVSLGLDVRDIDSERQRELAEELLDSAVKIASGRGIAVTARQLSDQSPLVLHSSVQAVLASAAYRRGTEAITMPSGASHDAAYLAAHVPTGMLFVPCREGVSHSPEEHADPTAVAAAVDVMLEAFRDIDDGALV